MALYVKKFGGTSVASVAHIQRVADKIIEDKETGHDVVVVVSAMGKETDRLVSLSEEIDYRGNGASRELDVLLSVGEQVTISLLSLVLLKRGYQAESFLGRQVKISTDSSHNKARIVDIDTKEIQKKLENGVLPVVAGFQGEDERGNITTLGRGGSDTTAVALAAALGADECQIYTDVQGIFTTDPRVVENARRLERITFEEMLELASLGSRVLHTRAIEFASKYRVPLRVASSFDTGPGTLITYEEKSMEAPIISGIAFEGDEAKLTILGVEDVPGIASAILGPISESGIEVDMILQNISADMSTDFTFTVNRDDYSQAMEILTKVSDQLGAREVSGDNRIAKVSMVGVGMRSHAGVASKMFEALAKESINIQMISTSEIKISVVIDEKYLELAVRTLHAAFDLEE
ncbi:MAG: aspartate kinase [Gammaproteobacteria bacterium]|nr:aspartate kinase [Gammaproteobacteria bacterium]